MEGTATLNDADITFAFKGIVALADKKRVSPHVIPFVNILAIDFLAPTRWKAGHLRIVTVENQIHPSAMADPFLLRLGAGRRVGEVGQFVEQLTAKVDLAEYELPIGSPSSDSTQFEAGTQGQGAHTMTTGNPKADTKADRPWYKKKRFVIPGVIVALLLIGNIAGGSEGGSDDTEPAVAAATPAPDSDNDGVTDDKAEAAATAAKEAAEEKAAQKAKDKRKKKIANAEFVSKRDLALVFKDPDSHEGELFKVWGEVTQFDAATGTDAFLAAAAHADTRSYGYFEGASAFFMGKEDALGNLVEEDIFTATVEVTGSLSYDTQIGGNTTVPQFKVLKIKRR